MQKRHIPGAVIGLLFEPLADKTWEAFTQERILDPLGMRSTYLHARDVPPSATMATMATGHDYYHFDDRHLQPERYDGRALGPAGTIVSNVPDMLKWTQFHIQRGRHGEQQLLSVESAKQLIQPHTPLPGVDPHSHVGGFYGTGFMVFAESGSKKWVQHAGGLSDCTSLVGFIPAQRRAFDPPMSSTEPSGGGVAVSLASNFLIVSSHRAGPEAAFAALPLFEPCWAAGSTPTIKLARSATATNTRDKEGWLLMDISFLASARIVFMAIDDVRLNDEMSLSFNAHPKHRILEPSGAS